MFNLKLALRTLFRTPFVTAVAILSLGLGIGANSAIFSVFNEILLKPLPVPDPGRLVNLANPGPKSGMTSCGNSGPCSAVFSYPMFRDLEKQQTPFTGIAAHRSIGANLAFKGQSTGGDGLEVSGSYFTVLNLVPALGRLINPSDDAAGADSNVVVLSHRYWQSRFQADRNVINETLTINGQPLTIVGVAPEGFDGTTIGSRPLVFVPLALAERMEAGRGKLLENRRAYWIYLFARLKPGVEIAAATTAINQPYHAIIDQVEAPLQKGMSSQTLERFKTKSIEVTNGKRGQSSTPQEAFAPLLILLAVTFVVLLSACANIANLLLAKAVGRASEMAVRLSIGAARRHLISQLLGESVLLAGFGGILGLFIAYWTLGAITSMFPGDETALGLTIDGRVLLFMSAMTLATGLLFGVFPAIHSTRPNLSTTLKGQAGQPGGARSAKRFRTVLATTQITLSMALLAISGLFLKSLVNVNRVDLGLRTTNVVTFGIAPAMNGYTPERARQIYEQVEDAASRIAGVTNVAGGMVPLLSGSNWGTNVSVEGFRAEPDTDTHSMYNVVGPDFFKTVGMALPIGREFTASDQSGSPKVAVVNEAFAKKFNLGPNPVGKRMQMGSGGALNIEIVGLTKNAKYSEVKEAVPALFFIPYRQNERTDSLRFYLATSGDTDAVMSAIQPMMARIDPTLPVDSLRTLEEQARNNVFQDRMVSTLASLFAGLATLLAAIGLYGVLAYTVAQRTREFGLRMALGADGGMIRSLVLRQVVKMILIGGGLGLTLAVVAGIYAKAILFEMTGVDPIVLSGSAAVLIAVAMLAGFIPALRASRVDPMRALRYE